MNTTRADPVSLEVMGNQLAGIAEEMGLVLQRTAYSPNIKERVDCSAAVFMPNGDMLAQAEHIPVHLGAMPASVQAVLERFGYEPDTQYAVNDPYAGGNHLNDLTLVRPVVVRGELVAWVANRAHHADVGGEAPGSMPAHATQLDQEGVIIPPMPAVRNGEWVSDFLEPFLSATRTPAERQGDLSAQLGANEVGANRMAELINSMGLTNFMGLANAQLDYGQRRMSAAISAIPDGTYPFTDVMELGSQTVPIVVTVEVDGDTLLADFSGTSGQVPANFNTVEAVTRSCLYYAVRVATDPTIPPNHGCYRQIELKTSPGSLVNAQPPAAVAAGNVETSQRIADTILGALAPAAPHRIPAASQGTMNNILVGNDRFAYYETLAGGQGGRPGRDGQSGIQTGMTNTKNTPIESLENHYPFRVTRYRLRTGSGGEGKFRGGEGIEREITFSENATLSLMGERRLVGPWGLAGGSPGARGEDWLISSSGSREKLPGKVTVPVKPGDRLLVLTPGGGGWGKP